MKQAMLSNFLYQYVMFEQPLVIQVGSGRDTAIQSGYSSPTTFIVPYSGIYMIQYRLDISTDFISSCSSILYKNGTVMDGSTCITECINTSLSNIVHANLIVGDRVSLLFWSNNINTTIGSTIGLGNLPDGSIPVEVTTSISFTKLS